MIIARMLLVNYEVRNKGFTAPIGNKWVAATLLADGWASRRVAIEWWCCAVVWVACHQHIMPEQLCKKLVNLLQLAVVWF